MFQSFSRVHENDSHGILDRDRRTAPVLALCNYIMIYSYPPFYGLSFPFYPSPLFFYPSFCHSVFYTN